MVKESSLYDWLIILHAVLVKLPVLDKSNSTGHFT